MVWTFKKFRYESDLKEEANVSLALDKMSQELKTKWKDNTKATKLDQPSLDDFSVWLKVRQIFMTIVVTQKCQVSFHSNLIRILSLVDQME